MDDDVLETNNLLSPSDVAAMCGVSDETVRKWIVAGALPFIEVGPSFLRRIYRRDAEAMIRRPATPDKPSAI